MGADNALELGRLQTSATVTQTCYSNRVYNKLFTKILDSTIWLEDDATRLVWITFLAVMDEDGFVALSAVGNVAARARVSLEAAEAAIKALESPDTADSTQEHSGRRIERVPYGWMVLNATKYRDLIRRETQKEQTRLRVAKHRAKGNAVVTHANEKLTPSVAVAVSEAKTLKPLAPKATPSTLDVGEVIERIPMLGGFEFEVRASFAAELARLYPAVDIPATLKQMRGWCIGNPTKLKTPRGIRKFITGWCDRDQNGS